MDAKVAIAAVLVVAIVVGAGAGIAFTSNDSEGSKYNLDDIKGVEQNTKITGEAGCYDLFDTSGTYSKLMIYGNVNNDLNIDTSDLIKLKAIIASGSWDKATYPFADVNCDKVVDQKDVTALEKIINKEPVLLYYVNYNGYPEYVHYPVTGNIGINYDYGYMAAAILGCYDKITAGTERWIGEKVSDSMYPGVHDLYSIGTDAEINNESALAAYQKAGVTLIMGTCKTALNNDLHASAYGIDYLNIRLDQSMSTCPIDPIARIISAGFILGKLDAAIEFNNWYTNLYNTISTIFDEAGITEKTFVIPYNTADATKTDVDGALSNGRAMGDYTNVANNLPLTEAIAAPDQDTGNFKSPCWRGYSIEQMLIDNPEVLIISMWGSLTDKTTFSEGYAVFKEKADYFSKFDAYKDGQVYGVCYETFGTYAGIAALYLLCSYIYPDYFNEADGWAYLDEYMDKYTMLDDNTDLKNCGGLIVYKLGKTTP